MRAFEFSFSIGAIVFKVRGPGALKAPRLDTAYKGFYSNHPPEVTLEFDFADLNQFPKNDWTLIFDSQELWRLFKTEQGYGIVLTRAREGGPVYRVGLFSKDFRSGLILNAAHEETHLNQEQTIDPLEYPLAEIIMVCLLSKQRGVMAHACGVIADSRGFMFAGNSGAGKSTMAGLWSTRHQILNDDRIILREIHNELKMYGTPWHGDFSNLSSKSSRIEAIFFLKHGDTNSHKRVTGAGAITGLFSRIFPPIWDPVGSTFTLEFLDKVSTLVPCYELSFQPGADITDYVLCRSWR